MAVEARKIFRFAVRLIVPLGLTCLLLWVLFRKVNFPEMIDIISQGCDYWWILAAMALSIVSHAIRAARWQLQLNALDIRPPFMALCCSIFGCYALNLVFPRLGELWRVTYISRRQNASFSAVFGSLVADRLADVVPVALMLLLTFIVAGPHIDSFLEKYPVGRETLGILSSFAFWMILAFFIVTIGLGMVIFRDTHPVKRLLGMISKIWNGFIAFTTMKGRGLFIIYTFLLWGCYYFQLYLAFFAFPFTRELCSDPSLGYGLVPCLLAFVLSAISMVIPSQGGLGPWNIAIMFGLAIYGVTDTQGTTFSILQWSGQTVMLIILGIYAMAYISSSRDKLNERKTINRNDTASQQQS